MHKIGNCMLWLGSIFMLILNNWVLASEKIRKCQKLKLNYVVMWNPHELKAQWAKSPVWKSAFFVNLLILHSKYSAILSKIHLRRFCPLGAELVIYVLFTSSIYDGILNCNLTVFCQFLTSLTKKKIWLGW